MGWRCPPRARGGAPRTPTVTRPPRSPAPPPAPQFDVNRDHKVDRDEFAAVFQAQMNFSAEDTAVLADKFFGAEEELDYQVFMGALHKFSDQVVRG